MIVATIIILAVSCFAFIAELSTTLVYGWFVSKEVTDVYMNLDEDQLTLNQFNPSILMIGHRTYITNVPFSFFNVFHIEGQGRIPRWSKLHNKVNEYFAIAIKNSLKK